ncbi:MAG: phage holin family protein [Micropruina sp.]|nr:phage holin family protein [Micropruina sp.]
MADQRDIAEVIKDITADVTTIVKGEIELAKAELLPQATSIGIGAGLFGAAGFLGMSAVRSLSIAAAVGLGAGYAAWFGINALGAVALGFTTVAVLLLIVAGILALIGKSKVNVNGPERTVAVGQESVEAVRTALVRGVDSAETEAAERQAARQNTTELSSHPFARSSK